MPAQPIFAGVPMIRFLDFYLHFVSPLVPIYFILRNCQHSISIRHSHILRESDRELVGICYLKFRPVGHESLCDIVLLSEMPSLQDSITMCSCRLLSKTPSLGLEDINALIMNLNCQMYKLKYIGIDDS